MLSTMASVGLCSKTQKWFRMAFDQLASRIGFSRSSHSVPSKFYSEASCRPYLRIHGQDSSPGNKCANALFEMLKTISSVMNSDLSDGCNAGQS
jgi:hypothetical protein